MDDNKKVKVRNKTHASVVYTLPEMHIVRDFMANAVMEVPISELRALVYRRGGLETLKNYLTIEDKEVVDELLGTVEPEYFYTPADVKKILETGTLAELEDFINFAPQGCIDEMKNLAVSINLNDMSKRDLIKKMIDFDITKAIELLADDNNNEVSTATEKTRKAATPKIDNGEEKVERKAAPAASKYNVVN